MDRLLAYFTILLDNELIIFLSRKDLVIKFLNSSSKYVDQTIV